MEITKFLTKRNEILAATPVMKMNQRDRESPAWTILLRMSQIRMFLLNL